MIAAIGEARLHGDLSENAEYHAAKDRQGWIEGQIAEIEDKMARAQVIDVSKLSGSQIKFGATVTVVDEDTEEEARYQIVGEHEADVKQRPRLHHLADRARDDRQGERRRRRGDHPRRRQGLRDHQGGVGLTHSRWPGVAASPEHLGRFRRPRRHRGPGPGPGRGGRAPAAGDDRRQADRLARRRWAGCRGG